MAEAYSRLENNPADVPNHVLFRLVADINKAIERREKEAEDTSEPFSLLDQLSSLPKGRAKALLTEEIARIRDVLTLHEEAYKNLEDPQAQPNGSNGSGDPSARREAAA